MSQMIQAAQITQKRKINQVAAVQDTDRPNKIYEKYGTEFGYLLNPNAGGNGPSGADGFYLRDEKTYKRLRDIVEFPQNSITAFLGGKGHGKSGALKDAYGCGNNEIFIEGSCVMVPAFFQRWLADFPDGTTPVGSSLYYGIVKTIQAACFEVEKATEGLSEWLENREGANLLFELIRGTNPKALSDSGAHGLEAARTEEPLVYAASKLKLYLSSDSTTVNRIVFIVDEAESLPEDLQIPLIKSYLRLFECMSNYPARWDGERTYVNLIFSLTPEFFQKLKDTKLLIGVETLQQGTCFDLLLYFEKKLEALPEEVRSNPRYCWDEAMRILRTLCTKYECKYEEMIMGLAERDVRLALEICRQILSSSWTSTDVFTPENERIQKYGFNNISVIRAISCDDHKVYVPSVRSYIPNVLENTEKEDNSLIALYIMSYFCPKNSGDKTALFLEQMPMFLSNLQDVFGASSLLQKTDDTNRPLQARVEETVEKLKKQGILVEDFGELRMTLKGIQIWGMFKSDSVLFEVLREDRYRNFDDPDPDGMLSSDELMEGEKRNQKRLFLRLIRDLEDMWDMEKAYVYAVLAKKAERKYKNIFNGDTMTGHLLAGVKKSIDFSGMYKDQDVYLAWEKLRKDINSVINQ